VKFVKSITKRQNGFSVLLNNIKCMWKRYNLICFFLVYCNTALALHLLWSLWYSTLLSTSSIAEQCNQDCCKNNKSAIVSEIVLLKTKMQRQIGYSVLLNNIKCMCKRYNQICVFVCCTAVPHYTLLLLYGSTVFFGRDIHA
jgi:hypothetical protein